jgi:lipoate-protein ligase A
MKEEAGRESGDRLSSLIPHPSSFSPSSLIPHPSSFIPSPCRFILDPPDCGTWNMAADQWLLRRAAAGAECCFRLYRWAEPTLSLGYFQIAADRFQDSHLLGAAVVRRISGGGAILHHRELTYCLVVPAANPLTRGRQALYRAVHGSIIDALGEMGIAASLCEEKPSGAGPQPFLCFQRRMAGDVLVGETKVAGSAQRRIHGAVLQHGSLLLARSPWAPELPGLQDVSATAVPVEQLIHQWMNKLAARLVFRWRPDSLSDGERSEVARLAADKYASPGWTEDRLRGSRGDLL